MKTQLFKAISVALLLSAIIVHSSGAENQFIEKKHAAWLPKQVMTLKVSNKYGDVNIKEMTGDSVTIDAVITVYKGNMTTAKRIFSDINIDIEHSGTTVNVNTEISKSFKTSQKYRIDYFIAIPEDRNLDINNKFGNVNLEDLTGKGTFKVKYGAINGNKLLSPGLEISISYGNVGLEETEDLELDIKYSKFFCGKCENVWVESSYSGININVMDKLEAESRYDNFNIKQATILDLEGQFTSTKIENLEKKLFLQNKYGAFYANHIDIDFEELNIDVQYCNVKLGIAPSASYLLNADMKYCTLKYPEEHTWVNKTRTTARTELKGQIGSGEPKGNVVIESAYGGVSLLK